MVLQKYMSILFVAMAFVYFGNLGKCAEFRYRQNVDRPIVGAIRWDAWHGKPDNVYPWMLKTLSHTRFHDRLPFFATLLQNDSITMDGGSQQVMDSEIHYAKYAGLDYWAFVTYHEEDALSHGLQTYLSSKFRGDINFCLITEQSRFWDSNRGTTSVHYIDYVIRLMGEDGYQRVLHGRPIWYLGFLDEISIRQRWGSLRNFKQLIDGIRSAVLANGQQNPYLVIMDFNADVGARLCDSLGADAISSYVSQKASARGTYAQLTQEAQQSWDDYAATGKAVVPNWVAGWNPKPRIDTPTPWHVYPDTVYYNHATPLELATHFSTGKRWIAENKKSDVANTAIIYAWNEFDEGGWLCPTRSPETGLPDVERILAVRDVLVPAPGTRKQ